MNIFEVFIKKKKQFILLIIGLPCSNKSELVCELEKDFKIPKININSYLKPDSFIEQNIDNNKFKLYEHPDNYDWDKLNIDVNNVKSTGVILYGNYINISKIDFNIDFSYFIDMKPNLCKKILIDKKLLSNIDDDKIDIYFTEIFNPLYEKLKEELHINKFFNINENTIFSKIYDNLFDNLIDLIKKIVY